jgi:hypothetical protein
VNAGIASYRTPCSRKGSDKHGHAVLQKGKRSANGTVSNLRRYTHTAPPLRITELGEDCSSIRLISHHPQDNGDCNESKDMDDEHATLKCGKSSKKHSVEDDSEQRNADCEQHTMPGRHCIVDGVQCDQTLDCKRSTVSCRHQSCLPTQDTEPSGEIAQESLVLSWGEFADPMVLAATLTIKISNSSCKRFLGLSHAVGAMLAISAKDKVPGLVGSVVRCVGDDEIDLPKNDPIIAKT